MKTKNKPTELLLESEQMAALQSGSNTVAIVRLEEQPIAITPHQNVLMPSGRRAFMVEPAAGKPVWIECPYGQKGDTVALAGTDVVGTIESVYIIERSTHEGEKSFLWSIVLASTVTDESDRAE